MEEYTPSWLEGSSSPRADFHLPEVPEFDPMPPPSAADPVVDVEMLETQGDSVDLSALASSAAPDMSEQAVSDPMQVGSMLGSLIAAFDPASEEHMHDRHIGFMNIVCINSKIDQLTKKKSNCVVKRSCSISQGM